MRLLRSVAWGFVPPRDSPALADGGERTGGKASGSVSLATIGEWMGLSREEGVAKSQA